jgi:type VI secretion system protein ImpF
MKRFEPSLFDKLFDDDPHGQAPATMRHLSLEELKSNVARDIESILNTRIAFSEELLEGLPECGRSVLTYGLNDFSGLSLASYTDRMFICRSIQRAIERHEPRLQRVKVALELNEQQSTNMLYFAIQALLVVHPAQEPVNFDAMLQPSTLQYSVSRSRAKA